MRLLKNFTWVRALLFRVGVSWLFGTIQTEKPGGYRRSCGLISEKHAFRTTLGRCWAGCRIRKVAFFGKFGTGSERW